MNYSVFIRGLIIGFSIAAPVGPIGVLCIRRTLASGRLVGLLSGLGAATADAFYGSIAAFGLTFICFLIFMPNGVMGFIRGYQFSFIESFRKVGFLRRVFEKK